MAKIKKTIIITGAAGKIGSALATDLIKQGNKVLLGDVDKLRLLKIKKKLNSKNVHIFQADLTTKSEIDKFIQCGLKKFKNIDSAVHCSYPRSKKYGAKFEDLEEANLKEDLYYQLGSSIIFSQRIIKYFLKKKKGNLILISSIQGVQSPKFDHYKGSNMVSPIEYSAVKSGIIAITKYLSKYYRNKNIRINCVSPGGVRDKKHSKLFINKYRQSCNSKGLLNGEDISKLITFLLSDESRYIAGQNLIIDDGWSV